MNANEEMAKQVTGKLQSVIKSMPNQLKNLPPAMQADMNRLSQLALKNGDILKKDGTIDTEKLLKNNAAMNELSAQIKTKDYGVHTSK